MPECAAVLLSPIATRSEGNSFQVFRFVGEIAFSLFICRRIIFKTHEQHWLHRIHLMILSIEEILMQKEEKISIY